MAIVYTDNGVDNILKISFNRTAPVGGNNDTLKLYTNNYTPLRSSVTANFTEAAGGGYAAKTLLNGSWTVAGTNTPRDAVYAQQTWIFTGLLTGSASIYGYNVVNADGVTDWAELLAAPFQPLNNGDQLSITPKVQASTGTPA